jgi:hypothetical protein
MGQGRQNQGQRGASGGMACHDRRNKTIKELFEAGEDWKVGAYEPSVPIEHGDIEYLYTLDLKSKTITYKDIYKGTTHTA